MTSADGVTEDNVSVEDIRRCLLYSLDWAEELSHNKREYAAAVTDFSQDIRRIKRELMSSFKPDSHPPYGLQDILCGLTAARTMAEVMRERDPEKGDCLTRFLEGLNHAQKEFLRRVRPDMVPQV